MATRTLGVSRTVVRRCAVGVVVAGCAGALLVGVGTMQRASAQSTAVKLAGATPYAVLTSGTVTGAGTSSITGDVGGSTVTGLDGRVTGAVTTGGGTAQALADLGAADDTVASSAVTTGLTRVGGTLRPGSYGVSGSIDVPGELTLDAGGDPDATFIIKTDAAFTSGEATSITLAGGARACNVFWLSGGSATIEGTVVGSVFGRSGITARPGATVTGRLLARSGAVRLDGASVHAPTDCDGAPSPAGPGTQERTGPTTGTAPPGTDESGAGSPSAPAAAGGSRSSRGAGTDGSTRTGAERDTDGVPARGTGGGGTGGEHASAGAGSTAGTTGGRSGGGPTGDGGTSARNSDAADGRASAPSGTGGRGERRNRDRIDGQDRRDPAVTPAVPGGAPVVTVPGLGPDDDGPAGSDSGLGRRVLGVLAHLPRPDGGPGNGTGSGLV